MMKNSIKKHLLAFHLLTKMPFFVYFRRHCASPFINPISAAGLFLIILNLASKILAEIARRQTSSLTQKAIFVAFSGFIFQIKKREPEALAFLFAFYQAVLLRYIFAQIGRAHV